MVERESLQTQRESRREANIISNIILSLLSEQTPPATPVSDPKRPVFSVKGRCKTVKSARERETDNVWKLVE